MDSPAGNVSTRIAHFGLFCREVFLLIVGGSICSHGFQAKSHRPGGGLAFGWFNSGNCDTEENAVAAIRNQP
jgi:hypothetical protein